MKIKDNARIVFIGDSITDAGRDRNDLHSLSTFSKKVESYINNTFLYKKAEVFNRGISGYRSADLVEKFDEFVVSLKPDNVIMLIGINDTWRRYDSSDPTDAETYYANVKKVISGVKKLGAEMLVLEPFLTKDDPDKYCYYEDLMPKILMLRKACREEGVEYVPLDGIMAAFEIAHPEISLSADGVHPNEYGSSLIAEEIIKRLSIN